ncbi:Chromate transporter family protein [Candidatus Desulfosporosinus infrequens]|uniref:Chromate transporter family protein n=1 Tax=Candidatus Desulfosporosinus infrequens TaxID=2043169 RepID=A0A2U3LRS5_9FIRM|nr:Chromate transporter family protein [Candidatus Desulfosporosinus infrequens]
MKKDKRDYKLLFELFLAFFKISPITFGGGFAMIPIMEDVMVEKKKWLEKEKLVDIFAVSQSIPGAIAVNSATFVGYQIAGIPGALAALVGIVLPTFGIILVLGVLLASFQHNIHVQAALEGIRPVVVALIGSAAYKMSRVSIVDKTSLAIFVVCLASLLVFKSLNLILVIFLGAMVGISISKVTKTLKQTVSVSQKKVSSEKL